MGSLFAGNVQTPNMIQAPNMNQAFGGAYNSINNLESAFGGLGSGTLPAAQATASNLYNNPYSGFAQGGADAAAKIGIPAAYASYDTGKSLTASGQSLIGEGQSLVPYASQVMQSGFDPQQVMYNQQLNMNQQQANTQNAQSGVAGTPYGAGVADQSNQNFNTNWENQQLGRQAQAAGAAGGLVGTAANVATQGANMAGSGVSMMNQAPSELVQSAMIPYATYSQIGQGQNQALSQLLGIGQSGANLSNMPISDLFSYLGVGNQTTSAANQTAQVGLNQSQLGWNQLSGLGQGVGNFLGNIL